MLLVLYMHIGVIHAYVYSYYLKDFTSPNA